MRQRHILTPTPVARFGSPSAGKPVTMWMVGDAGIQSAYQAPGASQDLTGVQCATRSAPDLLRGNDKLSLHEWRDGSYVSNPARPRSLRGASCAGGRSGQARSSRDLPDISGGVAWVVSRPLPGLHRSSRREIEAMGEFAALFSGDIGSSSQLNLQQFCRAKIF